MTYLNIHIIEESSNAIELVDVNDEPCDIQSLTRLHSLILVFIDGYNLIIFNKLICCCNMMTNLQHLEVTDEKSKFYDLQIWQNLFEISLPFLNIFILKIVKSFHSHENISFWSSYLTQSFCKTKKNYQLYFITHHYTDDDHNIFSPLSN